MVVVDNKLCQIMIFQINGRLVTKFGSHGTEPHQLAGPHFVAVSKDNFIYVSDFYNHCVKVECDTLYKYFRQPIYLRMHIFQIFSSRGDCLGVIGSSGEGCGQFNAPTGLAIDSRENLIVADWGNSRLQVRRFIVEDHRYSKMVPFEFRSSINTVRFCHMSIQAKILFTVHKD